MSTHSLRRIRVKSRGNNINIKADTLPKSKSGGVVLNLSTKRLAPEHHKSNTLLKYSGTLHIHQVFGFDDTSAAILDFCAIYFCSG